MGRIKELNVYTDKLKKTKKILLVSDIHKEKKCGQENLDNLKEELIYDIDDVDFIVIPGDLINDTEDLKDPIFRRLFLDSLESFTEGKPTIVSAGNHDKMTRIGTEKWNLGDKSLLPLALRELDNVTFIRNQITHRVGNICFGGFSPNCTYYLNKKESKEEYSKQFYSMFDKDKFSRETFNIFLTHEPQSIINLSKEKGECIQPNTDLVVSGHMHNGLVPVFLHKLHGNKGWISPQMDLFPKYAQGEHTIGDTDFIINGAVNTRVETPLINKIYGPNATIITINPSKEKQKVKRYY